MPDLGCWGGRIVETDEDGYTPSSVLLKCECGKRGWHTKNIGYIGARSIYNFRCGGCEWMREQTTECYENECKCASSKLSVSSELIEHVKHCEACRQYGL